MSCRLATAPVLLLLAVAPLGCGDGGASEDGGPDAGSDAGPDARTDADADAGPPVFEVPEEREACSDRTELKRPFFGDLHVHTRLSFDAAAWGTMESPEDAYAFARGEPLGLPPYDADGEPTRTVQLRRPLDFAAVTDHAEFLAETTICNDPSSDGYDSRTCESYRAGDSTETNFGEFSNTFISMPPRHPIVCRVNPELCAETRDRVWKQVRDAAEVHYDRTSSCELTTFVAWEWSAVTTGTANIHRNVIFRNATVPRVPTSYVEAPTPDQLWDALEATCTETGTACDAIAIPHNSNAAGGNMFVPMTEDESPYTAEQAARRSDFEPLVEIYQHKGASECIAGVMDPLASEDELCSFEALHPSYCTGAPDDPDDCIPLCSETAVPGSLIGGCVDPQDFVRGALRRGLLEQERTGENPFDFGLISSTDSHTAAAGHVEEDEWTGHVGMRDGAPEARLRPRDLTLVGINTNSAGGLAVLWAEENSRGALFDAMKRREAYATSGTRIVVRSFGGWGYPDDLCSSGDLVQTGYDDGVPMGGALPERPSGAGAPRFAISAMRDPGTAEWDAAPLQRVQVVKGWLEGGTTRERVYEVAGDPDNGAAVDPGTCERTGDGFDQLCTVWTDPDFDPAQPAFYYVRVLENPSCRWSHELCLELDVDCDAVGPDDPLVACCDESLPRTIQERAWTSPIFYVPS